VSEKSRMTVAEVMDSDYLLLDGLATVAEALKNMKETQTPFVLVQKRTDEDEYGIVLASDIAKHVLAANRSPQRINIYEIMTKPVLSVGPNMNIRYCARMFEHFGISTAPVVEAGDVKGVVTYDTLVLKGLAADIN